MTWTRKPCPICSKMMNPRAKICRDCMSGNQRVIRYDLVTDAWLSTFTGFFMGEGTANIVMTKGHNYQAKLSIALRADDGPALEDIKSKLGGGLYYSDRIRDDRQTSHPQIIWSRGGKEDIDQICVWLIDHCAIPCKKLRDVHIVREFIAWRTSQPHRNPDWSVATDFRNKLLNSRAFSESE